MVKRYILLDSGYSSCHGRLDDWYFLGQLLIELIRHEIHRQITITTYLKVKYSLLFAFPIAVIYFLDAVFFMLARISTGILASDQYL